MLRYLVFTFKHFYPDGGVNDLRGDAATLDEARSMVTRNCDVYQILDTETGSVYQMNKTATLKDEALYHFR